ncbi:porin [Aeoliella mucimassa]|uniref:Phosphate-selective porin O and P n=1 Tax=Aeoliella mucimassa TaxID=2527972 RepID=A0A518AVK9_9BACT|nr:porin [Aeoliella mucimassa]QDU58743.1 Phosphate-selective porin O and P [Aeoliella mucimassa]
MPGKPVLRIALAVWLLAGIAQGQTPTPASDADDLAAIVEQQAIQIRQLQERLDRWESIYEPDLSTEPGCEAPLTIRRLPVLTEQSTAPSCQAIDDSASHRLLHFQTEYDDGLVIRPYDPAKHPFELKINGWIQFRHHGFSRDVSSWTSMAGNTHSIRNRNAFDIERGRLVFSGYAKDPRLTYFLQLDGDTDGGHAVDFFDYWWAWDFSDDFQIQFGKRKVTASRQWLLGARSTRLTERPMACDFFRPDRTLGIFANGKFGETGRYELMVGNGYSTSNLPDSATDNNLTFAATSYFDIGGKYGSQIVDFQPSDDPVARLGHSMVYSPITEGTNGLPLGEADFTRLTDGTQLTANGALAPGVTVSAYKIYLYSVDFAAKYRGWSFNSEVYLRWIEQLEANGALPTYNLYQHGYFVEGGHFVIPRTLEWNVRYSQINGRFGNSGEVAVGLNWFPRKSTDMKLSIDFTNVVSSALQNTSSDILVGDDGRLIRAQIQTEF